MINVFISTFYYRVKFKVQSTVSASGLQLKVILTRKRAIAKALQLKGHSDFAPVDLAYYQHFLGFFVRKCGVLGSSAWQPQMQVT